jgi:mannose-6-phosphate isomerase-like protein (cupin superfamily)
MQGFVSNIEKDTVDNENFRKVLYTGKNTQLVLMTLQVGQDVGEETHDDTDQFFRVDSGSGQVVIDGNTKDISDGFAIVVPQGAKHNVINTGKKPLKMYSLYSPPHHQDGIIHKTKAEAQADTTEHFDGKTSEATKTAAVADLVRRMAEYVWEPTEKGDAKTLKYVSPDGNKFHVSPCASEKTWKEIAADYDKKYGKNHHHLKLNCVKCGDTQTCRCSVSKITEKGICPYCTGELKR